MTAISPLKLFHKKGQFGDYEDKKLEDLVKISEINNLFINQLVQYKNSKVQIDSINIDGLKLSLAPTKIEYNEKTRVLWNGPKNWLIVSKDKNINKLISEKCDDKNFAITDISHSRAIIQIKGHEASEILKKGCPIDFGNFKKNNCAGSIFNGINLIIDKIDDTPETFNLFVLRSFGESFYHDITDSALEYGYNAI